MNSEETNLQPASGTTALTVHTLSVGSAGVVGFPAFIYTLSDPDTGEVRYVGKTDNLRVRFSSHLREGGNKIKSEWVSSLLAAGKKPILKTVEVVFAEKLQSVIQVERKWVQYFKDKGARLVNVKLMKVGELGFHHIRINNDPLNQISLTSERKGKSVRYSLRTNKEEDKKIKWLIQNNDEGVTNMNELFRFLMHSEYNAVNGLPPPTPEDWQTKGRVGNLTGKPRTKGTP